MKCCWRCLPPRREFWRHVSLWLTGVWEEEIRREGAEQGNWFAIGFQSHQR